jgi:(p)ppGpp synthase/HD superfamily hydrolase
MSRLVERARAFAIAAHAAVGQRRKYTDEPYHVHLAAVAQRVQSVPHTESMVAAAWLHDTREDTHVSHELLAAEFGSEVAELVDELTDVSRPGDGNRATRKALDRAHLAQASTAAQTIKLADLIDNTSSIVQFAPAFARIYLDEKRALLDVLVHADATLLAQAWEVYYAARQ